MMRYLNILIFLTLLGSCNSSIKQDHLNGKWQTYIEDDNEYYEIWISDSLAIWLNSQDFLQTYVTKLSNNQLNYTLRYDRFDDTLEDFKLNERLTPVNDNLISVEIKPSKKKYLLMKINNEKFGNDFRKVNFDSVQSEFKKRQYQYFKINK